MSGSQLPAWGPADLIMINGISQGVDAKINAKIEAKATLVLPLATLIETGNHIAQANHRLILWATFMEV